MKFRNCYLFFLIFSYLFIFGNLIEQNETNINEENVDEYGEAEFQESLKEYLQRNNLYENKTAEVPPEKMRELFKEVLTGGEEIDAPPEVIAALKNLTEQFITEEYTNKKRTVIMGNELFDLFNITDLSKKFEKILNETNPELLRQMYENETEFDNGNDTDTEANTPDDDL